MVVKDDKNAIALVCSDGALQGGFIAGAIIELYSCFPEIWDRIDLLTASSASVGNALYYLSHGQKNPGEELWTKTFTDQKFVDMSKALHPEPAFDIGYLVENVLKKRFPLSAENIVNNDIKVAIAVLNHSSCRVEIFTTSEEVMNAKSKYKINSFSGLDIHSILHAAMSIPILYDKKVELNGSEYVDAGMVIPYVIDEGIVGARKKILVANRTTMSTKQKITYAATALLWEIGSTLFRRRLRREVYLSIATKHARYRELLEIVDHEQKLGRLLLITPDEKLGRSFDNSPEALRANFDLGKKAVRGAAPLLSTF